MADVELDPQNSNPKELYGQGVRAFVLQDYDTAVRAFSKTSELLAAEHGNELHDSLGDVYLYYGKALLELSRKESGPLGDGVLKNVEEESESEEIEEEEDKPENDAKVNGDSGEVKDGETEAATPSEEAKEEKPAEQNEEKEKDSEEASGSTDKKEGGDAEEELTDLQVAWEVLELAKRIFTSRSDDGKKNLAETLIVLGEISLESGNFPSAVEDMMQGLQIQKTLFGNDSRTIAETHYKLGGAYATNGQIDEAIESFNSSLEYLKNKVNNLEKDEEHKADNAEEIEELNNLIPEIQEKIADMKNLKAEIASKVSTSSEETVPKVNGSAGASSSKQVNDISHLVKRKRKGEEPQEENPPKKPSP